MKKNLLLLVFGVGNIIFAQTAQESPELRGEYFGLTPPGFILTINKYDSQLKVQATGQGEGPIIPIAQNVFVIKGVDDAQLIFNINEAGEVESMTLHQNGMDNICKKLAD